MSQKLGSYSDLELDIAFDRTLEAERLKSLANEVKIQRISKIVDYNDLDLKIKQDFCKRLESVVEKHKDGIKKDTRDYINSVFKILESVNFYEITNNIELDLDYGDISIEHFVNAGNSAEDILSKVQSYDLKNKSDSFKAFITDLEKLLNDYGFVVEDYGIKSRFNI